MAFVIFQGVLKTTKRLNYQMIKAHRNAKSHLRYIEDMKRITYMYLGEDIMKIIKDISKNANPLHKFTSEVITAVYYSAQMMVPAHKAPLLMELLDRLGAVVINVILLTILLKCIYNLINTCYIY